ncbi:alpha/beta hydrolase [Bacillus sp. T33-2]|uniref:alpha/beta hydrolase n=1 Tax=Bacillus sp. T33-2 TaxID=2054168 RepID=UPI000C78D1C0|nr:alpha/beta hydrolase-fold protein [Bacillus sp. T33-2]PLR95947.1 hypothetical protein CVD19_13070 [Bacillus sp. T33-2]
MTSTILERQINFYILQPETPPNETINVLYVQDGDDYLKIGKIQECFEQLLNDHPSKAENLSIILVPPGNSIERYNFYHPEGSSHEQYLKFFYNELIPEIEKIFAGKRKRIQRQGLLGDSLGGAVSLSLCCRAPEKWTHLILQSAAFSPKNRQEAKAVHDLKNIKIYQLVGKKEDSFVSPISNEPLYILTNNREMRKVLATKQVDVTYIEEDEEHLWVFWQRDLPRALSYFLNN